MSTIAVIDYGMGNLHSVAKALSRVSDGQLIEVTSEPERVLRADRVVFPGVGAIRDCISELTRLGMDEAIREVAKTKPLLAVCVGFQALMERSSENDGTDCLGIVPGSVEAFANDMCDPISGARLKVPHMGWNQVHQLASHPMWRNIPQDARFYFVHSYYVQPASPEPIAASTAYGHSFVSAIAQQNLFAVQFHPEKSQHAGLTLYANFLNWDGES